MALVDLVPQIAKKGVVGESGVVDLGVLIQRDITEGSRRGIVRTGIAIGDTEIEGELSLATVEGQISAPHIGRCRIAQPNRATQP